MIANQIKEQKKQSSPILAVCRRTTKHQTSSGQKRTIKVKTGKCGRANDDEVQDDEY